MPDLLTTDEAATYLRMSERKLYELVAHGAVPCSKVTGRWLFPKAALDRWVAAGLAIPAARHQPAPPIGGGSHDPLLEWALRESGSGLASLPEGSEAGLGRLTRGEVMAAALDAGCTEVVIGIGGSASTDGGAGMVAALGARLLDAAIDFARTSGARVVEAYPLDPDAGKKIPSNELFHGVLSTFEEAGFREVARPKPHLAIVSLDLAG